jgi:hypothetical protein
MLLSPAVVLSLSIATLLIYVWIMTIAWKQFNLRKQCESQLLHVSSHQDDLELLIEKQLLEAQENIETTIDLTTTTVRTVHKGIAAIPFGILEAIPTTRLPTKVVRVTHDVISDVVYSSIKITNKISGKIIRKGISKKKFLSEHLAKKIKQKKHQQYTSAKKTLKKDS